MTGSGNGSDAVNARPTFSIVLPTFNRALLVTDAIASVLAQTTGDWELIVVDDGSTDGTEDAVAPFLADARVQYRREGHGGRSRARNIGVEVARGEFVGFLDSDDSYLPNTLQTHLDAYASNPGAAMTVAGYDEVDEAGFVTGGRRPWSEGIPLKPESWLFDCFGIIGTVAIRREWLARIGGFMTEPAEDWDLFLRLAYAGCPIVWVPAVVYRYRRHPGNSTVDVRRHLAGAQRALDRLFASTDIPLPLGRQARAWTYAVFARTAAAAGDDALTREALAAAMALRAVPRWRRRGFSASPEGPALLLEGVVADALEHEEAVGERKGTARTRLAGRWGVDVADVRKAMARVAMRRFFEAVAGNRSIEAAAHLRTGLKDDPRWLANPAVMGFAVRRLTRHRRRGP